mmetsp:Transcript_2543/g.6048  ORF Transcript_2543/g.6048 Transcript_2543/m.6048 type:complete len:131 (+) Transcript_2543:114-506(+)
MRLDGIGLDWSVQKSGAQRQRARERECTVNKVEVLAALVVKRRFLFKKRCVCKWKFWGKFTASSVQTQFNGCWCLSASEQVVNRCIECLPIFSQLANWLGGRRCQYPGRGRSEGRWRGRRVISELLLLRL